MTTYVNADFTTGTAGNDLTTFTDTTGFAWVKTAQSTDNWKFATLANVNSGVGVHAVTSGPTGGQSSLYYANALIPQGDYDVYGQIVVNATTQVNDNCGIFGHMQAVGSVPANRVSVDYTPNTGGLRFYYYSANAISTIRTATQTRTAGQIIYLRVNVASGVAQGYYNTAATSLSDAITNGTWTAIGASLTLPAGLTATGGYAGISGFQTPAGGSTMAGIDALQVVFSSITAVGNLGDMNVTGQYSASVTCPTPTGGSGGPYTYQWYKDTVTNFTPGAGNIMVGEQSQTVNLAGLTPNTNLWLVCRVSDGSTSADTFHRLVRVGGLAPISLGYIGDSTSLYSNNLLNSIYVAPKQCRFHAMTRGGCRQVTLTNPSVSGTATQHWQSGGTNMNAALAAFAAASPPTTHVILRLGCNDAQAAIAGATFNTNYGNIVTTLTGNGYKVFLDYPTWREPGNDYEQQGTIFDETYTPYLLAYLPLIDAYINNTTVFRGGQAHLWPSMSQPFTMLDNTVAFPGAIHWSDIGSAVAGGLDAYSLLGVTNPVNSLTVVLNTSNQPVLTWSQDVLATNYKIYRAATALADSVLIATVGSGTLTYTDTTAPIGPSYYEVVSTR